MCDSNRSQQLHRIIYEPVFDAEMKDIHSDFFRVDEFIQGAEWTLARDPSVGSPIYSGSPVWCLPVASAGDLPDVVLYYAFNALEVYFLSIKATAEDLDGEEDET